MAFSFRSTDESLEFGFRRIALRQLGQGLAELDDPALDPRRAVFQVRKRGKKLRALIRLVRPAFPDYADENAALRDMARPLSGLRDREALAETFAALNARHGGDVGRRRIGAIGRALSAGSIATASSADFTDKVAAFRAALVATRDRALHWRLDREGFAPAAEGAAKVYAQARDLLHEVDPGADEAAFHAWRKRVKYHWYHVRLLRGIDPETMLPHAERVGRLAELLGEHHDLALLRDHLADVPDLRIDALLLVEALIERRSRALDDEIFALGAIVFEENPGTMAARWEAGWDAWRIAANDPSHDFAAGRIFPHITSSSSSR